MHKKNIFLILLIFNNLCSASLPNFVFVAKNFLTKSVKNVSEKEVPSNLRYVMQLFRMYCVVAWIWYFLSLTPTIEILLGSVKTKQLGLFFLKNRYNSFNQFNNTYLFRILNPCNRFFTNKNSRLITYLSAVVLDITLKVAILSPAGIPIELLFIDGINLEGYLLVYFMKCRYLIPVLTSLKDLSSLNLTHLSFNQLEPIIPLLLQNRYFQKYTDIHSFFIDYGKTFTFLSICLENEKYEDIKELFSYIVKNSGSPEDHVREVCEEFIKVTQEKKTFSLNQLLIFLENTSLQFPEYKILELSKLILNNIEFSNDDELKEISNQISNEQREMLFKTIQNNLVSESKKTDDYNSEKISKIQDVLKYFIEKHQLTFEKIIIGNFKNLRLKNILFLNQNVKIYRQNQNLQTSAHAKFIPEEEKQDSNDLFHYWVRHNADAEINFFKENIDYMLSLDMDINQFDKVGKTVLDIFKLSKWSVEKTNQNMLYLKHKGAKSFFKLFRECISEKTYYSLQATFLINRFFLNIVDHRLRKFHGGRTNKIQYDPVSFSKIILGKKTSKITIFDFFNFLFSGCCEIKFFDSIYNCAKKHLMKNPFFANTTPYSFWGEWFFGIVNRIHVAVEESEIENSNTFLEKFLALKLPFNITIQNERGENAFHLLALSGKYEFIQKILDNCQPMIDANLIKKDQIKALFNNQMKINNNFNIDFTDANPLNMARNQYNQNQEEKYQKTIEIIEKYLEN